MDFFSLSKKEQLKKLSEIEKKAEEGDLESVITLAFVYSKGEIVPKDIKKSQQYFEYAASKHYAIAEYNLGYFYSNAENGYPIDYKKAVEMYKRAAAQNELSAISNLGFLYTYGFGDIIKIDLKKAVRCAFKAAKGGRPIAQRNLGLDYYHGDGIKQNYAKAIEWFTRAIKSGETDAYYDLGKCYYYGHGVEKDLDRAFLLMMRAAVSGDADAKKALKFHKRPYLNKTIKEKYPDIMTMDFHLGDYPDEFDDEIEDIDFSKEEIEEPQNNESKKEDNTLKGKVENMLGKFFNGKKMKELKIPEDISQNPNAIEILRIIREDSDTCKYVIGELFEDSRVWGILMSDLIKRISEAYEENGFNKDLTAKEILKVIELELGQE